MNPSIGAISEWKYLLLWDRLWPIYTVQISNMQYATETIVPKRLQSCTSNVT